ncbi:hypothetical protein GF339_06890 [candidate division KSB3 bacterium]|uniref:Uncharacterized protein n=1 Tax=candidate division KSB3 bacterium TaxID=2044937 RepID=A0A9D5JU56_9BACT|nr:hypothetical protein [candidate division KSB3 bacterium]MBD3324293.1 hypothetical protein [candidate division KSB3 bacterium]
MNTSALQSHVQAINACNQRGERMLSLVDLLDAGTVDLPVAAYLAAAMRSGASLLVGANPGGAGKTAVMGALLNFLPNQTTIRAVASPTILADAQHDSQPGHTCYLAHEIGAGYHYAYVWEQEARDFFRLAAHGHIIVANLHADTLNETHDQLCCENGVERRHVDAVTLKLYLRVERTKRWSLRRRVSHVYENDGSQDHLLWTSDKRGRFTRHETLPGSLVSQEQADHYAQLLNTLLQQDIRRIEEVRTRLLQQPA